MLCFGSCWERFATTKRRVWVASTGWYKRNSTNRNWDNLPSESYNGEAAATLDGSKWTYLDTGQWHYITKETLCGSGCGSSRSSWNRYNIRHTAKIHDKENDESWWENLRQQCLQFLTANGRECPQPYVETPHATKPNELLHFYFSSIPKGLHGYTYVLVLADGMSGFCELVPTTGTNTEVVVQELMNWFKRHGSVFLWVSYLGSQFIRRKSENPWTLNIILLRLIIRGQTGPLRSWIGSYWK